MQTFRKVLELLERVDGYGGRFEVRGGNLFLHRPRDDYDRFQLDALSPEIKRHKDAIIAHFRSAEEITQWEADCDEMIALMHDADGLLSQSRISGTDSEVVAAVSRVLQSHQAQDLESVQLFVAELRVLVKRIRGARCNPYSTTISGFLNLGSVPKAF